jgi:CheY-like chemotaxis protein
MNKNGPIVIEDDPDDKDVLIDIFGKLNYSNEVICFLESEKALDYLNRSDKVPFLVLSDINMPRLSGLGLKRKIHTDAALQGKCIPYQFFTTSASKGAVVEAYSMSAQGFFIKETTVAELEKTVSILVEYWKRCFSPNQYEV